jgi:hypothetical protein
MFPDPTSFCMFILLILYLRELLAHALTACPTPKSRRKRPCGGSSSFVRRFRRLKCLWEHRKSAEQKRIRLSKYQRAIGQTAVFVMLGVCLWLSLYDPDPDTLREFAVCGCKAGMVGVGLVLYVAFLNVEVDRCGKGKLK